MRRYVTKITLCALALLCIGCTPPSSRETIEKYANGDAKGALEDLQRAAGRKDIPATFFLAHLYETGDGVERDNAKANNLYMAAANLGLPRAQAIMYVLALADKKNRNVEQIVPALAALAEKDPEGSLRWYCEGLQNLAAEGEYEVSQDFIACLEKLKDVDIASASTLMASAYFAGLAFRKDDVKGVEMAKKAVANGDLRSLPLLATAHARGMGAPRDLKRAYAYAQAALTIGSNVMSKTRKEEMIKIRDSSARRASGAELREAESLAEKIKAESKTANKQWRQKYLFGWALQ